MSHWQIPPPLRSQLTTLSALWVMITEIAGECARESSNDLYCREAHSYMKPMSIVHSEPALVAVWIAELNVRAAS